ncbi:hypothetical protein AUQ37_02070 [Candidatus Methanomethylophilus sp. 1R26]|jgi:hypothetical protein|uniref:DUF424 domain-containing protein n=1 Tax=Candidatus Methanomethylophilus sp. 1R26 TaxID=1769296 RepID=UPI0007370A27|nr:DUF424 family protein [Candidatus Methanomethylophilus sp. 1R26]MCH3978444.1 DUF424 family protein [Methanomethylophilus sp.]TQS80885.1 MAG: hypothetical protein A3Q59_06210 [Methanomethylophilus alvi]WII08627.1 DUF424 family protein [Methanomassiliicoccales archaeon LGM-DZ1]KUE73444.1 hypothetical protein AUQ37_02070 [Candidatus Methanomethylophilus sp. 1R26]MCI2074855.1 DUF424 family protein [Methanomethylophilus sp.]
MAGGFYFRTHRHPKETIIAVCDEEVLGKTFAEGKLHITVNEGFYGGDLIDEAELRSRFEAFTILNIAGNRAVDIAVEMGIIDRGAVLEIGGIRHAQAVTL